MRNHLVKMVACLVYSAPTMRLENRKMNTVEKMAHWIQVGDVIVAPDQSLHTVTEVQHHGLQSVYMSIRTDTGLLLNKSVDEARLDWYDVLVQEAAVA